MDNKRHEVARRFPDISAAFEKIYALCRGEQWRMSVPVQDTDTDIVIMRGFDQALDEIARLQKRNDTLEAIVKEVADLHEENEFVDVKTMQPAETPNVKVYISRWVIRQAREAVQAEIES
jgi:hypothetical protein